MENLTEIQKLNLIGKAAKVLAEAAKQNNVSIKELLPLVTQLATKELNKA